MTSIAIVSLGKTALKYYFDVFKNKGERFTDQVWTINHGAYIFQDYDLTIAMDDMRWKQKEYPGYIENLTRSGKPIMTSTAYPEFPNAFPFPLDEANQELFTVCGRPLLNNSCAYAIAYALMHDVKDLYLYGYDFKSRPFPSKVNPEDPNWRRFHLYENLPKQVEPGEDAIMYLLGIAKERGVEIHLPEGTTLFNKDIPPYWYGYV